MVIQFPLCVSSKPRCHTEFQYIESGLFVDGVKRTHQLHNCSYSSLVYLRLVFICWLGQLYDIYFKEFTFYN